MCRLVRRAKFFSYRLDDNPGVTGRFYNRLAISFGADVVMVNVDFMEACPACNQASSLLRPHGKIAESELSAPSLGASRLTIIDPSLMLEDSHQFLFDMICPSMIDVVRIVLLCVTTSQPMCHVLSKDEVANDL